VSILSNDTSNTICENEYLTFNANAPLAENPFFQWLVNGLFVTSGSPIYYDNSFSDGDVVSCVVINTTGCAAGAMDSSNSIVVTVVGLPSVSCSSDSFITGQPTYFSAIIDSGGIPPFTYIWDFGDFTMGAGDSVAHIYLDQGVYDVQLNVVDANGCEGVCNDVVTIYSLLFASFSSSATTGCSPLSVDFTNSSSNAITYLWEFGDGNTTIDVNPSYTYVSPGSYDVTLHAYGSAANSSETITNQVMVLPSPVANFQAYPGNILSPGDTVFFADNSLDAWSWSWDFGDPGSGVADTSTLQNPNHLYNSEGVYTVGLLITNSYGCADSLIIPGFITVSEDPVVSSNPVALKEKRPQFQLAPNPFAQQLTFYLTTENEGVLSFAIMTMEGKKIFGSEKKKIARGKHVLDLGLYNLNLAKGLYFFELEFNDSKQYQKLIKE
jgi:PKD repeat protein